MYYEDKFFWEVKDLIAQVKASNQMHFYINKKIPTIYKSLLTFPWIKSP